MKEIYNQLTKTTIKIITYLEELFHRPWGSLACLSLFTCDPFSLVYDCPIYTDTHLSDILVYLTDNLTK